MSLSLNSSMIFIAVSLRQVRPIVSMNVLWLEISSDTIGIGDSYFKFLAKNLMLAPQ